MNRRLVSLTTLLFAVAAIGSAGAQGRRMMGGRMGGLMLLNNARVQTELKMTPEQISKIQPKQQEVQGQMRELFQNAGGFQNMSDEDRQKLMGKIRELQSKAVADILDATQQKRFRQIQLQVEGPLALARKENADGLKLTDEQRTKVADIQRASQREQREAMQGVDFQNMSDEDRQKLTSRMQAINKTANEKIEALLTDDQKKQWKAMLGDPFKLEG